MQHHPQVALRNLQHDTNLFAAQTINFPEIKCGACLFRQFAAAGIINFPELLTINGFADISPILRSMVPNPSAGTKPLIPKRLKFLVFIEFDIRKGGLPGRLPEMIINLVFQNSEQPILFCGLSSKAILAFECGKQRLLHCILGFGFVSQSRKRKAEKQVAIVITGFFFVGGRLLPLPESTRSLSADDTGPAEVAFTRDGNNLIVTERLTNLIDTFNVGDDGQIIGNQPQTFNSSGIDPFGFAVSRNNQVFVSEADPGVNDGSSASAYTISDRGDLNVISASVSTRQSAACWLTLTPDDRFVYTANAGSGTLSGFRVGLNGSLNLLEANGIAATIGSGSHPVDLAPSQDGQFLFSLANGNGTLGAFQIAEDGSLKLIGFANGIPTTAAGLAAQ